MERCNKTVWGQRADSNLSHKFERENNNKYYKQDFTNYPTSVLTFNNEGNTIHPTQKPVALVEYMIKTYSKENEIILDNCMGSGTTGIACLNTNRSFIGIEKDKEIFEMAKKRIETHIVNIEGRNSLEEMFE